MEAEYTDPADKQMRDIVITKVLKILLFIFGGFNFEVQLL
ncbi:hypothetical protein NSMM_510019 [Nitrosomonas mobilis]|uniref:Uncharacterized protein n=1 Tax=Nitrosomonas mobilis TaxID=51642 RepID=A0A1G5SIC3_9PROT|nr:hypothetical protein NSMM_510019 [Nitrosomonas mobilis]